MDKKKKLSKLINILREVKEYKPDHHLGRPFLSAYQIAIKFAEQNPNDHEVKKLKVGGKGIGESNSLTKSIAVFLSSHIKENKEQKLIQGGFISHMNLTQMTFISVIHVSTLSSKPGHSIFRYVGLKEKKGYKNHI